jgi:hypothetical protein
MFCVPVVLLLSLRSSQVVVVKEVMNLGGGIAPNKISDVRRIVSLFLNRLRHRHKRLSSSVASKNELSTVCALFGHFF